MRRLITVLMTALLLGSSGVHAGTSSDPEILDHVGDAHVAGPSGLPANADWADIAGVWFTGVRDANNTYTGFRVHIGVLGNALPAGWEARFAVEWQAVFCDTVVIDVWRTVLSDLANFHAECEMAGMGPPETLDVTLPVSTSGNEIVVHVPNSMLWVPPGGLAQTSHWVGADLVPLRAASWAVVATGACPTGILGGCTNVAADTWIDPIAVDRAGLCGSAVPQEILADCARPNRMWDVGS